MERMENAALSKIADILSDNNISPIVPVVDIWKKIFNNSEQMELFTSVQNELEISIKQQGWDGDILFHNPKTYNALLKSFIELEEEKGLLEREVLHK